MMRWPFGGGGKGNAAPTTPATPEGGSETQEIDPQAKLDKALNDPKFVEFLEMFGEDAEDIDVSTEAGAEAMAEKYETFKKIDKVSNQIKTLLQSEVISAAGIKLDKKEDLGCIDKYLQREAIDSGLERINEMEAEITRFQETRVEIARAEREIKTREAAFEKKSEAHDNLKKVSTIKRLTGWWLSPEDKQAIYKAERAGLNPKSLRKSQQEVDRAENSRDSLNDAKNENIAACDDMKNELFDQFESATGLMDLVRERVKIKLTQMAESGDVNQFDKAQEALDNVDERFLDGLDTDFQDTLDLALERKIAEQIREAVGRSETGPNQLKKMEDRLEKFFKRTREETGIMGSKDTDEIKDFIGKNMAEAYRDWNLNFAQRIVLKRACAKNGIDLSGHILTPYAEPELIEKTAADEATRMNEADARAHAEEVARRATEGKEEGYKPTGKDYEQATKDLYDEGDKVPVPPAPTEPFPPVPPVEPTPPTPGGSEDEDDGEPVPNPYGPGGDKYEPPMDETDEAPPVEPPVEQPPVTDDADNYPNGPKETAGEDYNENPADEARPGEEGRMGYGEAYSDSQEVKKRRDATPGFGNAEASAAEDDYNREKRNNHEFQPNTDTEVDDQEGANWREPETPGTPPPTAETTAKNANIDARAEGDEPNPYQTTPRETAGENYNENPADEARPGEESRMGYGEALSDAREVRDLAGDEKDFATASDLIDEKNANASNREFQPNTDTAVDDQEGVNWREPEQAERPAEAPAEAPEETPAATTTPSNQQNAA